VVGYDRLELPALPALERIHDLARDYVNFLHLSMVVGAAGHALLQRPASERLRQSSTVRWSR
jgi:hypothetical protein